MVIRQTVHCVATGILTKTVEVGIHSAMQRAEATVEAEPIGTGTLGRHEVAESRLTVPVTSYTDVERIGNRNLLRTDENEAARVISRILSIWHLHNGKVVDLRTRDHVEGEGARVSLTTRHGAVVDPYIIITLRQAADHHELVIDKAYARHTAYHLSCIAILRPLYLLCRDVTHYDGTRLGRLDCRHIRILPFYAGDSDLAQLLFIS